LDWIGTGGDGGALVFFPCGDMVLALCDRAGLAVDSCVVDGGGWGGITLAHNVGSATEVDEVTELPRSAGGTIAREPADTFWSGYDAIVLDPDGHPWEIAFNPGWALTPNGGVRLS
jgi:uncharacterized glyoxalase superfamily protein PhnB